ncbi:TetR/AcrR family transcriptional regulator [Actinomadura spongiicola]|uniref:TetR/AcrR family transcriptional regulator n=1 Tax=Actinomadura spongiicola TaxID=2303421 RepID=A0A372GFH5_9ACTN|nr:TetR family transcriptional regulator C-terminal domain-containing protein [Actinomadura spongiicola]RFS84100.1 TetR/AcrR family transcriptional regulator [Actinomadura spongiicola]
MTDEDPSGVRSASTPRGRARRDQLVRIGLDLLAEGGWSAITARAVADRARIRPGLLHHYFNGLPGLHVAVAQRAGEMIVDPVVEALLAAPDTPTAVRALHDLVPDMVAGERRLRLAAELLVRALRDPRMGAERRDWTRAVRGRVAGRLAELCPEWPAERREGTAMLVIALLDGLMLQLILDPGLSVGPALDATAALVGKP